MVALSAKPIPAAQHAQSAATVVTTFLGPALETSAFNPCTGIMHVHKQVQQVRIICVRNVSMGLTP